MINILAPGAFLMVFGGVDSGSGIWSGESANFLALWPLLIVLGGVCLGFGIRSGESSAFLFRHAEPGGLAGAGGLTGVVVDDMVSASVIGFFLLINLLLLGLSF